MDYKVEWETLLSKLKECRNAAEWRIQQAYSENSTIFDLGKKELLTAIIDVMESPFEAEQKEYSKIR